MKVLISALSFFEEDWLLSTDLETSRDALTRQVNEDLIDIQKLRSEYLEHFNSHETDWVELALKAQLFSNVNLYSPSEIKDIIELYLRDFLFPELGIEASQLKAIELKMKSILEAIDGAWINVDQLVTEIKIEFPEMRSYMIYLFEKFFSLKIESSGELAKLWIVDKIRLI